jgi:hypothetical protein
MIAPGDDVLRRFVRHAQIASSVEICIENPTPQEVEYNSVAALRPANGQKTSECQEPLTVL